MSSNEAKARALALRALGRSYREIERDIRETLKESVDHNTVARWCSADPELQGQANQAKLRRLVDQDTELGIATGEMLAEMLPALNPRDMAVTHGIIRDKIQGWVKIIQDERRDNTLLDTIRRELRQKQPSEIRALALATREPSPSPPARFDHHRDGRDHIDDDVL
jgi:hypothetical protein